MKMISHADTAYMLFTCDTIDKYADLLNIIFNVKFIERAIELKALIDNQLFLMKPHLSKIIGWYDMLILRYYNCMWYAPEYDEVDYKYPKEVTTDVMSKIKYQSMKMTVMHFLN